MVDLHMHSRASDGSDHIEELLTKVRDAGIRTFSVTDHDTIVGALEMEKIVPKDMMFIKGIEFSSITKAGKCHILGYDYDQNSGAFKSMLEEGIKRRKAKTAKRVDFLKSEFGIELTEAELNEMNGMTSVGKPFFGNLLVKRGLAKNKKEAIKKYIDPCKTEESRLDGVEVIKAILSAGGIPIWAHPFGGTEDKEIPLPEFQEQLEILTSAGLKGLECYYANYSEEKVNMLINTATKRGLYISGGSDYHGTNKTIAFLGKLNDYGLKVEEEMFTVLDMFRK